MDAQLIPLKQIMDVGVLRHNRQNDVTRGAIGPVDVGASPRSVMQPAMSYMIFIPFYQFVPPVNSVVGGTLGHDVPCLNPRSLLSRRNVKAGRQDRKLITIHFAAGVLNVNILGASSGASSPQSSITSIIFSSSGSSSSRSPPSSHNSFTDNAPFPSVLVRRQPRIQVSSLLADSFTRSV